MGFVAASEVSDDNLDAADKAVSPFYFGTYRYFHD